MVIKYKQKNDLTVLLEPIDGVVSVSVGLWIKTGSRDELEKQYGYAHFVEHMLFKGTEKYTAKDIAKMVDRVGGQHNAATNREYTCFYINVVSDYLELALEILSDMFYNSLFDEKELEKEKKVIIEEIRMYEDTPDEYVHDLFMESMLTGHPLSHPILGTVDGIEKTTRESITEFYDNHYTHDNSLLVIAGNFDEQNARDLSDKYFYKKDSKRSFLLPEVIEPKRKPHLHVERSLEQVHFCLGVEGITKDDEMRWPLYILGTVFGGSMSSRLFQNIREKEGISYSIYSFHSSYLDCGVFGIYCGTSPDTYEKAINLIIRECRDVLQNGITKEEFDDAKTFMKGNLALSLESTEVRMGQMAKNEITYGKSFSYKDISEKIDNISYEEINIITKKIFSNKELSVISVGKIEKDLINNINLKI